MITHEELRGHWNEIKGRIKERWGQLSDDDLREFSGNTEQLIGIIQQRTGAARAKIEDELERIVADGNSMLEHATESARQGSARATQAVQEQYEHLQQAVQSGYNEAQTMVRSRPMESVAVAFAAGLISGVIVGLVGRSR